MKIDLSPEDIERIVAALEHMEAYRVSQQQSDGGFKRLADRLRRR